MRLAVFSGTSEGRRLCGLLSAAGIAATACVATSYGSSVMPPLHGITLHEGRMNKAELTEFLRDYDTVADATHPYAAVISDNLIEVCGELGIRYLRLLRPENGDKNGIIRVGSTHEASEFLSATDGNVLLTTGSKELFEFTAVSNYKSRLFTRILPDIDAVRAANELGFTGKHLICMQGPFSREMNAATLRSIDASYLVTKDTGDAGGLTDKLAAAQEVGVSVVMITRPRVETGFTLAELFELLTGAVFEVSVAAPPRFPLFVSLNGQRCVIIGGGAVACRRAEALRQYGADITVIAPEIRERIDGVTYHEREYKTGDLQGMFLAVAATNSRDVNAAVTHEATQLGIHLSVADRPQDCTFWFPASCVNDAVSVGLVSRTGNHNDAANAAKLIRKALEI